jgi:hypothetical protein
MSVTNNNKYGSIARFLPAKVISGNIVSVENYESWMYDDGLGDPYWQGANGISYKWLITANIDSGITHSSYLTRIANIYTGLDITNGMWVMATDSAPSVRINEIKAQSDYTITFIAEDVDRFNTFNDTTSSGDGIFNTSQGTQIVFFQLGDDGLPMFNPLPTTINGADPNFMFNVAQVESRFRVFNPTEEVQLYQVNHGFTAGDIITIDQSTSQFRNANSSDIFRLGTVTVVGPGPNYFYVEPVTKILMNLEPSLPGPVGGIVWIDPTTGDISTSSSNSNAAVYMKVSPAVPTFSTSSIAASTLSTYNGFGFSINQVQLVLAGTAADPQPVSYLIDLINSATAEHGVIAQMGSQPTSIVGTVPTPTAVLQGANMQFAINGVTVTVTPPSIVFGVGSQLGWWDFVRAINELTDQHGVYATLDIGSGLITLTNNFGSAITIEDITPAATSGGHSSFKDACGFPSIILAGPANYLQLIRPDGGPIVITDNINTGSYLISSGGINSAANGSLPMALVIDQSMYANANYVVPNIAARDALSNMRVGDQAYVQADANGQWAMYLYTASGWVLTADKASAATDANTLELTVTPTTQASQAIGVVSASSRIINVTVQVTTAFDGTASVSIGTNAASEAIMAAANIDLSSLGNYEIDSSYVYADSMTDFGVYVYFTPNGASHGQATVIVSYL